MATERSSSILKEKVLGAMAELFPEYARDPLEMFKAMEGLDESSAPISNAAGDISLHYGEVKETRSGSEIHLVLIFGDPHNVNSETGDPTSEEFDVVLINKDDKEYTLGAKRSHRGIKKFTKVLEYSRTLLRRRHILTVRRHTHKGGARRQKHRRSTRRHHKLR